MEVPEIVDISIFFRFWEKNLSLRQNIFVLIIWETFGVGIQGSYILFFLNLNVIYKNSDIILWLSYELVTREIY